ncbi:MAG TPA: hypothetical protein VMW27_13725 [Thermoanaerobaculia bacterium]|nr:hypothetical protein [Thermoanaerobaculia bacterium]
MRRALLLAVFAVSLSGTAFAQTEGARELALGKEAYARRDYPAAVGHFGRAVATLDARQERAGLADAYFQLGLTQLVGLGASREALAAFLGSTAFAEQPASAFLWAALAAERLGQAEASARYKALALQPPGGNAQPEARVEAVPAAPEPAPAPAPAPEVKEADAFQHFFGPKGETEKPAAAPAEETPKEDATDEEEVDSFQYFFGKKKPEASEEKPPR